MLANCYLASYLTAIVSAKNEYLRIKCSHRSFQVSTKQSTAVIQLEVQRPVCLELYQDCKDLGRFMLRSGGNTIAAGVVTKVGKCISANLLVTQD